MKIQLSYKPRSPIIIEGFPGFGLVGTIATEFLIKHLKAEPIGKIRSDKLMPIAAIHENKIVEPIGIFYVKKYNLVIIHALSNIRGLEWKISNIVMKLAKDLNAKEIISLEGVGNPNAKLNTYYFTKDKNKAEMFKKIGLIPLNEGIVMGVSGALMLKSSKISCIFVESSMGLADSKAAAKIIEVLDRYLGLKVDFKPLLKAAKEFEGKLKEAMAQQAQHSHVKKDKNLDYMG